MQGFCTQHSFSFCNASVSWEPRCEGAQRRFLCHYQDCKSGVDIIIIRTANQGWVLSPWRKIGRGCFWRAISSRWIEDVKQGGVRVKTGEWKEVQMSRIWSWRQAPGSFVFCVRRKSFVYIFWWLLHHATERGVVLTVTQQTLVLLYMDLVLSSSLYFIMLLIDISELLQQKPSKLGLTTPGHANCNLNRLKNFS